MFVMKSPNDNTYQLCGVNVLTMTHYALRTIESAPTPSMLGARFGTSYESITGKEGREFSFALPKIGGLEELATPLSEFEQESFMDAMRKAYLR
jgi:hypothetical protein